MDPILTGLGLASAAGLNAYIPLLLLGIAGRLGYADVNAPYTILSSNAGLAVLAALLLVELLADKVPGVDHVNDIINTVVRPAAGGLLFVTSAGAGQLDPTLAAILGLMTAGSIHATKAGFRPLVTATTGGARQPGDQRGRGCPGAHWDDPGDLRPAPRRPLPDRADRRCDRLLAALACAPGAATARRQSRPLSRPVPHRRPRHDCGRDI